MKKIEPPTGNVKAFRLPHSVEDKGELNKPYRVSYYDFKGPIRVRPDRNFKPVNKQAEEPTTEQLLKVYILSMTCGLTRHTTSEICEDRSYQSTKLAVQRIFCERGTSKIRISDQEPSFKALEGDMTD